MRSDYETMREIINGFSDPDGRPTSDGLAAWRARRPLKLAVPHMLDPQADEPYPYDLRTTFARRSSTTDYAPEPLDAEPLLASVQAALVEDAGAWEDDATPPDPPDPPDGTAAAEAAGATAVHLEPFVVLLRSRGAPPGVYRIRTNGTDLVANPPDPEQIEGMTVQKEFARAGAIVSVAANLDEADAWAGAHGYRHAMARAAAVIYSVHLRSAARGLTGTVFAGLSPSAVRHLLDSDGVGRHQMFAATVAVPPSVVPLS